MSQALRLRNARGCAALGLRPIVGTTSDGRFVPAVKYRAGLATDDVEVAAKLVLDHPYSERLGLVMGECNAGNVFGLDVDRNHGGADGVRALRAWLDEKGLKSLPLGPRWKTPRGGYQMIFRAPPGLMIRNMSGKGSLAPSVDVRGFNGLLTIPPTERRDGLYSWVPGLCLFECEIPEAPPELIGAVRQKERPSTPEVVGVWRASAMLPRDDAEQERRRRYIETAINSEIHELASTGRGGRNHALFRAAAVVAGFAAGEPALVREKDFEGRLMEAACANGSMDDDGFLVARNTIHSGFRRGREQPRHVPPTEKQKRRAGGQHAAVSSHAG